MAVKTIRQVPHELPHARLYLDDVQEISLILLDAFKNKPDDDPAQQPTITYALGNLRMDSIQDLRERGGSTSALTIQVENSRNSGYRAGEVTFFRFVRPVLRVYSLNEQERWSVYSRIKAIFDARRLGLKNAIIDLPGAVKLILYLLVIIAIPALIEVLTWKQGRTSSLLIVISYWFVVALIGFALYRHSRVFLVDSHERTKLTAEARRGYLRDIGMLVLGVIITKVGELLIAKLFK